MIVVATAVIDSEFALGVAVAMNGLDSVWDGGIIGVVTGIRVDSLTDVNVKGLVVETTALEFTLCSELLEEAVASRPAAIRCRPMALLGCGRGLQTWMPSYHV